MHRQDINDLAKSCGVDPLTIEQAAHAVCRRLIEWHGDEPIDVSQDIIETALLDHVETNKRMSIRAHMNRQRFARQVLGRIKQGNQHDQWHSADACRQGQLRIRPSGLRY